MSNNPNPLRRYLLRKDFLKRVRGKLEYQWRKLTRDAFSDQKTLVDISRDLNIFDIGANVGLVSQKYITMFPQSHVHAFEPFPDAFDQLKLLTKDNKHLKVWPYAVADTVGESKLFTSNYSVMNSLVEPIQSKAWGFEEKLNTITVQTTTIDSFCQQHDIDRIGIMKLDVQGGGASCPPGRNKVA